MDITQLVEAGYLPSSTVPTLASDGLSALRAQSGLHAPVVVLTEGRTDAEFLKAGLEILFPHLTDVVRFLDYESRPEGGVGALVRLVHSFAAAGIANRVVAIFDNDTAATEALRTLNRAALQPNIVVIQYPNLEELRRYPTLGPPTDAHPNGTREHADVNGTAGSIELYLGRDVLTDNSGQLSPVQWRSFSPATGRYQGEVLQKGAIQTKFRAKVERSKHDPSYVEATDWSGLRQILTKLLTSVP